MYSSVVVYYNAPKLANDDRLEQKANMRMYGTYVYVYAYILNTYVGMCLCVYMWLGGVIW